LGRVPTGSSSGVSTLTTTASMEEVPISSGAESAAAFPPLKIIWNCPMIERCIVADKKAWLCKWCNKTFTPDHATRAMRHVLKITGGGISTCSAIVREPYLSQYRRLHQQQNDTLSAQKRSAFDADDSISSHQESATQELLAKCGGFIVPTLPQYFLKSSS